MKSMRVALFGILFSLVTGAGSGADDSSVNRQVDADNRFACNLYLRLAATSGNLIFSPYSVSSAMAMAFSGARGRTADQMSATLRFELPHAEIPGAFRVISDRLTRVGGRDSLEVLSANSLWGQKSFDFRSEFLSLLATEYGAPMRLVDFDREPEGARRAINQWVVERTKGRISELLGPGPSTRRLLWC